MDRRGFLRAVGAASALWWLPAPCRGMVSKAVSPEKGVKGARVALVRKPGVARLTGSERVKAYRSMLEAGLGGLGEGALARALQGRTSVGLKLNCLAGRPLSPSPELVEALASLLRDAGVRTVVVWERSRRELARAGFASAAGYQLLATDEVGYTGAIHQYGNVGSLLSQALFRADALVSVGVLKDHDLAGISCGLKNLYGVIHNPNKYHGSGCDPFIAEVACIPAIRERLCLVVLDAALAQCHGGPSYRPAWSWPWEGIVVSLDPVAADAVAAELIDRERTSRGLPSLADDGRPPSWILTAGRLGLGEAQLDRITLHQEVL